MPPTTPVPGDQSADAAVASRLFWGQQPPSDATGIDAHVNVHASRASALAWQQINRDLGIDMTRTREPKPAAARPEKAAKAGPPEGSPQAAPPGHATGDAARAEPRDKP